MRKYLGAVTASVVLVLVTVFAAPAVVASNVTVEDPPSHRYVVCHVEGNGSAHAIPPAQVSNHVPKHVGDFVLAEVYPEGEKWNELKATYDALCNEDDTTPTTSTTTPTTGGTTAVSTPTSEATTPTTDATTPTTDATTPVTEPTEPSETPTNVSRPETPESKPDAPQSRPEPAEVPTAVDAGL